MLRARPMAQVAVLAAATALTASACTSFAANVKAQNDPLNGMSGTAIAKKAMTDTEAAPSVRISGTMKNSGQGMSINLLLVNGKGCAGTMSQSQLGSFQLVYDGSTAWVMPDKEFWKTQGGKDAAALTQVEGKYLKVQPGGNNLGDLVTICSLRTLMGSTTATGKNSNFGKATRTTYKGQQVVKVPDTADRGYAYITDTAKPELIRITASGTQGGSFTFSYPAKPPAITAPPASEVVDGSKYGF